MRRLLMQTKSIYRIRNWSEYNRDLMERGDVTIWMDEKAVKNWFSAHYTCRASRAITYLDEARSQGVI